MIVFTVSQINFYLKSIIDEDENLSNFFLEGEISNFKNHYKSGHMYFSLKDNKSVIRCVMFSDYAKRIKFIPSDGLKVLIRASLGVYESMGQYQLYVYDMQPYGLGSAVLEFEQLKEKLLKQGLFDDGKKKKLPKYPQKIGLITAKDSAAQEDIKNVLKRRFPLAELVIKSALVQGKEAAQSLVSSIEMFNSMKDIDLIIIARGGGSQEDLSAFNDEKLAYAIYNSNIPIVSGVGHQTDFTICDLTADLRAPTPSAAAEVSVPDFKEIYLTLDNIKKSLDSLIKQKLNFEFSEVDRLSKTMEKFSYENKIATKIESIKLYQSLLYKSVQDIVLKKVSLLDKLSSQLKALNPVTMLSLGYAVVSDESGKQIKKAKDVNKGQHLNIKMEDGYIECIATNTEVN
ncbi:MAG: exodeoxyribonuclease VII large subunit [Clostridia bacterium]|nr:exodeoxyribonuclease VII large subunit [Clostridia bacterium]